VLQSREELCTNNQICIHEEIILNSENSCYHSFQNLLSFRLLSRNIRIEICRNTTLSVILGSDFMRIRG